MSNKTIKHLYFQVVEHTTYDDKVIHIENVSYDMAIMLVELMNKQYDSYFTVEDMDE